MDFAVPDHIAYCFSGGRPIFLDVERNRYFTVPQRLADAFVAFVGGERTETLAKAFESLVRHGLLVRSTNPPAPRPSIGSVQRSLTIGARTPFRLGDALGVTWVVWRTWRKLGRGSLSAIVCDLKLQRTGSTHSSDEVTLALCERFLRHRSYVPIKSVCLLDSLALLAFLRHRGGDAELVFGVTASPFSAHCWIQRGDQVLNDTLDRVLHREPIMVI